MSSPRGSLVGFASVQVIAYIGKLKPTSRNLLKGISDHFVQCLRGLLLGDEAAMAIIVGKRVHLAATVHVIDGKTAAPGLFTRESERRHKLRVGHLSLCEARAFFDGPQRPASLAAALAACKKHKAKLVIAKLHRFEP
jgi:hypothetical protein